MNKRLTKAQKEVLNAMTEGDNTLDQLKERTGKKWGPLTTVLAALKRAGLVTSDPYSIVYKLVQN